jgi:hypothetical protein
MSAVHGCFGTTDRPAPSHWPCRGELARTRTRSRRGSSHRPGQHRPPAVTAATLAFDAGRARPLALRRGGRNGARRTEGQGGHGRRHPAAGQACPSRAPRRARHASPGTVGAVAARGRGRWPWQREPASGGAALVVPEPVPAVPPHPRRHRRPPPRACHRGTQTVTARCHRAGAPWRRAAWPGRDIAGPARPARPPSDVNAPFATGWLQPRSCF